VTNDAVVSICAIEAGMACKGELDLMERIRKAMKAARGHWMCTEEADQFRAALAAAIAESTGEERGRLVRSVEALNRLGAALNALSAGVPVDIAAMEKPPEDMLPLRQMWKETE
jgi:hypothetical protein